MEAFEAAKAAEAEAWAAQQLHEHWEQQLSSDAMKRKAKRMGRATLQKAGRVWEKGSQHAANVQVKMKLSQEHLGSFAEQVGEGNWERAQDMLPSMMQGLIGVTDSGVMVSVAAVLQQADRLLKEVRSHAARMESIRAPWTRVTARLLTSQEKKRMTRMWDYVITFLVDMNTTLQSRRRIPKRVMNLVLLVIRDLRNEVVAPFIRLTKRAAVVASGQGGDIYTAALREDVKEFMTGLRRLQALMLKMDWKFGASAGVVATLSMMGRWVFAAVSSVLSVFTNRFALTMIEGLKIVNVMIGKTEWTAGSIFQHGTQWVAATSWERFVLFPHRDFLKELSRQYEQASADYKAAVNSGTSEKELEHLKEIMRKAGEAVLAAMKPGADSLGDSWRVRLSRILVRIMSSFSDGSWSLSKGKKDFDPLKVEVKSPPLPKGSHVNLGKAGWWPGDTDDADHAGHPQAGWGYRIVTFPYKLTVMFAEVMLRLLGRLFTGNLLTGADTWAEKTQTTTERETRSWWRSLLGSDDGSNDAWLFSILKAIFVTLVFPFVVRLLFGIARGAVKRLFGSATAVTHGVLNNKEQWQCDNAAATCRAVLIPREGLGKTFTSRKACDLSCAPREDPIEDSYRWEMEFM